MEIKLGHISLLVSLLRPLLYRALAALTDSTPPPIVVACSRGSEFLLLLAADTGFILSGSSPETLRISQARASDRLTIAM